MIKIQRKSGVNRTDQIVIREKYGVTYLTFPILEQFPWLLHGFSTRLGGVSQGDVGSMNLSFSREPDRENVIENHRRFAAAVGYESSQLVCSRQTHTVNVKTVTEADRGLGYTYEPEGYNDVDGLTTNVPGLALMTFYADCVPLLIVDPVHRAIAGSHSGWRGTVADMGGVTIRKMQQEYGTDPKDVVAVIAPSICQECYEVSEEVIEQFRAAYDEKLWMQLFYGKADGKYQLNLQEACRQNFLRAGVPEGQISMPDLCTCCNPELLFSHRASAGKRGNLAAVIMLR